MLHQFPRPHVVWLKDGRVSEGVERSEDRQPFVVGLRVGYPRGGGQGGYQCGCCRSHIYIYIHTYMYVYIQVLLVV